MKRRGSFLNSEVPKMTSAASMDYTMNTASAPTGTYRASKRNIIGSRARRGRKLTPRQKQEVRTLINRRAELKYFHSVLAPAISTSAFAITGVPFDIPQSAGASTDTTRIGDSITWCGTLEMNFNMVNSNAQNYNYERIIIFQWHDASSAAPVPTVAHVLLNGPSGAADILSSYNHDYRHQYTILFDNVYSTAGLTTSAANTPTTSATNLPVQRIRISLTKLAKKNVQYIAGSGQANNRLFIISGSGDVVNGPVISWDTKVFFRDS